MIEDFAPDAIDGQPVENLIYALLREKNLTLSVAESLTGGLVSAKLINVAGISAFFREGIVAYANEAKIHRLGVSEKTISSYGAVSSETACEMAKGLIADGTEVAISTTGDRKSVV